MKLLTGDKKETNIELTPEDPIRARKKKFDVRSSGRRVGGGYGSGSGSGDRRQGGGGYGSGAGFQQRLAPVTRVKIAEIMVQTEKAEAVHPPETVNTEATTPETAIVPELLAKVKIHLVNK